MVDSEVVSGRRVDRFDAAIALGFENVFHFHRFNDRQGITGLNLLAGCHMNGPDEAGHRAKQQLGAILWFPYRKLRGQISFTARVDEGFLNDATKTEFETISDWSDLEADVIAANAAIPYRFTRPPIGCDDDGFAWFIVIVHEGDMAWSIVVTFHGDGVATASQHHDTAACKTNRAAMHLLSNGAPAHVVEVIDAGGDRDKLEDFLPVGIFRACVA